MSKQLMRYLLLMVFVLPGLTACGGGGGGGSAAAGGTGGTGVVSTGVMTKGSIIVNGVRFEDTTANISIDDTPKTAIDLRDGMVVAVLGTVNADEINGSAQQVEAQIEVRGEVSLVNASANPQSFVVLGQTVLIDDLTILNDVTAPISSDLEGVLVEVHGLRDTTGQIRATRIEANPGQMGDDLVDEIRGVVSGGTGTNPVTFNLGSQAVNVIGGAVISPPGASYQDGSVVEVHCDVRPCAPLGVFQASRIEVEDAEDSVFQPGSGQRFEVEGIVSGLAIPIPTRALPSDPPPALSFKVAGVSVTTSGSTRFVGGIYEDMNNNIKVEAEGTSNGSVLVARKIEFKRSVIRLQGLVTASSASSFTLTITGAGAVTVEADDLTTGDFAGGAVPPVPLDPNACIQVRGQRKAGSVVVVTAGEISNSCSSSSDHLIQAPVEVESGTTLTLLGFAINVGNPTNIPPYRNIDDSSMTSSEFFNAVVPANPGPPSVAGTLVKVRFNTPSPTVKQVELED